MPSNSLAQHPKDSPVTADNDQALELGSIGIRGDDTTKNIANVVDWNGANDPTNPLNFSVFVKTSNIGIISTLTFLTPLASSMFAPGIPQILDEFESKNLLLADFVVSVFVLGFAVGPLILAPVSEIYGRLAVYHVCNLGFLVFLIACGLSTSLSMLIVCRFLLGCFGSAPVSNGGGSIADLIPSERRGTILSVYSLGPLLGPIIGPVAGGFLISTKGWRWVFWLLAIVSGCLCICSFIFLRETYPTVLLERKTRALIKTTGNTNLRSATATDLSPRRAFIRAIVRPSKILIFSPIAWSTSLYMGIIYGQLYLMFATFTSVFQEQYGFSTSIAGLTFLGIGIGNIIGLCTIGSISDRIAIRKAKRNATEELPKGTIEPEYRLPPAVVGAFVIPVGLLMYGWSAQYKLHWLVPQVGTALVGLGMYAIFMCITIYLVDAFPLFAASAIAANTVVRSIMGALLPLAGQSMYASLGLGWGNTLLGLVAVFCIPVPWILIHYGERMRKSFDNARL